MPLFYWSRVRVFKLNIMTEKEYEEKLARIEDIFDTEQNTPEGDELETLCSAIKQYNDKNYPIPEPTKEAIEEFIKDQCK